MKSEYKYITIKDWVLFFISTFLIFLSSILLIISGVIFACFRLAKKHPVSAVVFVICVLISFFVIQWIVIPIPWEGKEDRLHVIIKEGDSMSRIVDRMKEAKLINHGTGLLILAQLLGKDRHIRAGRYEFEKRITLYSLFNKLIKGEVILKEVTIPEGFTLKEIAGILKREIEIDSSEFVRVTADSQFTRSMGIPASNLEGYLFPETYKLTWGTSPQKVAQIMVEQFKKIYVDSLAQRSKQINFSQAEVVTLASMVEAEARDKGERRLISAVYHNRLKLRMFLQCCPTVTYGLLHINQPLTLEDLERESPYNTYKYPGLPPGPICNPGKASIYAALFPADVNYLYFVSRGDGTHIFSSTLEEHNRAKSKINHARKNQT